MIFWFPNWIVDWGIESLHEGKSTCGDKLIIGTLNRQLGIINIAGTQSINLGISIYGIVWGIEVAISNGLSRIKQSICTPRSEFIAIEG